MYLNLIQLAESFGISESVVEGWVRDEDLPHTLDRGRLMFDRAQVAEWAARRGLAAKAGFLAREAPALGNGLHLEPLLRIGGIWHDLPAAEVAATFERIVGALPGATPPIRQLLGQRVRAPNGVIMSPIGGGFALPHPSMRITLGRGSGTLALLMLRDALSLREPAPDTVPIVWLWFFIAPSPRLHLDLLARLSRLLAAGPMRDLLAQGAPDHAIFAAVAMSDQSSQDGPNPQVKS